MPPISPAHGRDSSSSSERVAACVDHLAQGGIVIVTDDEDRENEGDLIMVADNAGPADLAFFLQHTSGVVCASLSGERLDQLALPLMVAANDESFGTAFTVTVDLADGVTTGISALDRARTLRALSDPASVSADFVRPGHVFPLRAHPGGVLGRPGHTEAAWDLSRMAGGNAGVLCEVVSPDRTRMANGDELTALAIEHDLPMISIAELVQYRQAHDTVVDLASSAAIATEHGEFVCQAWRGRLDGVEHIALVRGDVSDGRPVLVRVHSECLTGDVFGSRRCDCGSQLDDALAMIDQAGRGVVVYLRGHEGRGIGLTQKLRAYELQDQGLDTVDANLELGLAVDAREYGIGAQILRQLGVHAMRLMTNNPDKGNALAGLGLEVVEHVPLPPRVTAQNLTYLRTKRDRMAHDLPVLDLPVLDLPDRDLPGTTPAE